MPSKDDVLSLQFPTGGFWKRTGYNAHPPFFTPDALNVRPDDALDNRQRGGARGGTSKFSGTQLGGVGTREIRLIYELNYVSGGSPTKILLAVADNGVLYKYSSGAGTFSAIGTANVTLDAGRQLQACEILGLLYIATDENGNIAVYDPGTDTLDTIDNTHTIVGTAPTNCWAIANFRNRLVCAVDRANPYRWYMSRQGVPYDFEYGNPDAGTAVAGHLTESGQIIEPVTALIAHGQDCLLFGCASSMYTMRSDPAYGGSIDNLSHEIGVTDRHSWCHDSEDHLYFLSHDGVYWMPKGCGDTPVSISRERLPEELLAVDRDSVRVSMRYDTYHRGVRLYVTNDAVSAATHYWLDTKVLEQNDRGGPWASFWPFVFPTDAEATFLYSRPDSPQASSVCLMGCRDGFIRVEDESVKTDATTASTQAYDSYVMYGPIALSRDGLQGMLTTLEAVLDAQSDKVSIEIRVGNTAEAAVTNTPVEVIHCGNAGWNRSRPRHRGTFCTLKVKRLAGASSIWSLDEFKMHRRPSTAPRRFEI